MQCMKCGRSIPDTQVFCDKCLEAMDRHPVKPGTPVQILSRTPKEKTAKKKELSPEELLLRQKRQNRLLRRLLWIVSIALLLAVGALAYTLIFFVNPPPGGVPF